MRILKLLAILVFVTGIAFSQNNDSLSAPKSLLWKISGKELKQPSYIFGTIHMIPKKDYFFLPEWENCFNQCNTLALEVDLNMDAGKQFELAMKAMLPNGKQLKDFMTADEYNRFSVFLKDSLKISPFQFNMCTKMKPFFSYSLILLDVFGKDIEMYETNLNKKAQKQKMNIVGLETLDFQMSLVDSIPISEQVKMFLFNDQTTVSGIKDEFYKMLNLYKAQDVEGLLTISSQQTDLGNFESDFLIKRNNNWIPVIEQIIKTQSSFIAVGAAHLGGKNGVLQLLKNNGYTVTPVN